MSSPLPVANAPPLDDIHLPDDFVAASERNGRGRHWFYDEYNIALPSRFPLPVIRRVHRVVDWILPTPHTHRLCNIPRFAGWGEDGRNTFLGGRNFPIRITVLGCVVNRYVLPRTRSRVGQSGLEVDFVRDVDRLCMERLLRHARPEPTDYPRTLTAYKLMGSRMLLPHVYDARSGLSSTEGMNTLSFDAVHSGQLVMLDMKFRRRWCVGGGLRVSFDLVSVILLEDLPVEE